jgi:tryptophan synthase alpha chain
VSARLHRAFERAAAEDRAALVIYLCAGDPNLSVTPRLIEAAAQAGADVIEVGMPFSDPTADGPTIQRASERALRAQTTLRGVLDAIAIARETTDAAIVLFGYYNPILRFGEEALAREAKRAGVDGVLVVDLPPESAGPLLAPLAAHGVDFVPLVAPTSTPARIDAAAKIAGSFLYCVSMTGVTGSGGADLERAAERAAEVRDRAKKYVAVGFGIRTPGDVARLARAADGIVVGSAIVDAIAAQQDDETRVAALSELVRALAGALKRG